MCFSQQRVTRLNLKQADSLFLQNNFLLLAQRFNIDAANAQIIQHKLWPNPEGGVEVNINNPNKAFDIGSNGQRIFTIQQLIELAGKRGKRIKIAELDAKISEADFYDLLRSLKFELHTSFYNSHFILKTIDIYNSQLDVLKDIIAGFKKQQEKGNISLKELIRLQSLEFQLRNDLLDLEFRALEQEKSLKLLIGRTDSIVADVPADKIEDFRALNFIIGDLIEKAYENRPDLKIAELALSREKMMYQLQKAMAVPDLNAGLVYDRLGSAYNNYFGLSASTNLPVWNRNQGNIKTAKALIQSRENHLNNKNLEISTDVVASVNKVRLAESHLKSLEETFSDDIESLNKGVLNNFQKRNLSLIEFIDFFESYNESIKQMNRLKAERISALEELNYHIGTDLYKP